MADIDKDPLDPRAVDLISGDPELAAWIKAAVGDDLRRLRNTIAQIRESIMDAEGQPLPEALMLQHAARLVMEGDEPPVDRHGYALAKDECRGFYDGPDWCPFNLWNDWEFGPHGPNPPLTKECAGKLIFSPGAKELWALIAERYERPDNIALALPMSCAEFLDHWKATPKRTPSEHREFRLELQRRAEQLAVELERFFDRFDYEDYSGPPNFTLLLSESEQDEMLERIQRHNYGVRIRAGETRYRDFHDYIGPSDPSQPPSVFNPSRASADTGDLERLLIMDDEWNPGVVPNLPSLLRRVGAFFAEDAQVPPLQRPNAENAERNYFVRRLIGFFVHSFGNASPAIVARITSMFFPQGITENEVSKQMHYLPDGRFHPRPPEVSG